MNILLASLLNMDPLTFGLIIGAVILVAVAVILYIFIFRKKIKSNIEDGKVERAKKADAHEKSTNMASDIFAQKEKEEEKEERTLSSGEIKSILDMSKNANVIGVKPEAKEKPSKAKEKPKEKPKSKEKEEDKGPTFDAMGQFNSKMK